MKFKNALAYVYVAGVFLVLSGNSSAEERNVFAELNSQEVYQSEFRGNRLLSKELNGYFYRNHVLGELPGVLYKGDGKMVPISEVQRNIVFPWLVGRGLGVLGKTPIGSDVSRIIKGLERYLYAGYVLGRDDKGKAILPGEKFETDGVFWVKLQLPLELSYIEEQDEISCLLSVNYKRNQMNLSVKPLDRRLEAEIGIGHIGRWDVKLFGEADDYFKDEKIGGSKFVLPF